MPTAIVTGATGILGREIVHALGKDPETWPTVYAFSRSQKETYPPNIHHAHIDLSLSPNALASQLSNITAEYIFFAAYVQEATEAAHASTNGALLSNFLSALRLTGAERKLKRFVLVTGAKQYGLHLGRVKVPMEESDPRIDGEGRPPNFYYVQQDIMMREAERVGWDWVVTYPNDVIGLARNNFMSLTTPLALYATLAAALNRPLDWPGSPAFYTLPTTFTSAKQHADFCLWAALAPQCSNQGFNVVNGDVVSWQALWPRLARRFGVQVPRDMLAGEGRKTPMAWGEGKELESRTVLADVPPIVDYGAGEAGLEGTRFVEPSAVEARVDLERWSRLPEVRAAWEELAEKEGLEKEAFDKATWGFLKFILGRNFDLVISGNKAREYGYTGFKDTWAAFEETFRELEDAKVIPKTK